MTEHGSTRFKFKTEEERLESIRRSKREWYYRNRERTSIQYKKQTIYVECGESKSKLKELLLLVRDKIKSDPTLDSNVSTHFNDPREIENQLTTILCELHQKTGSPKLEEDDELEISDLCFNLFVYFSLKNIDKTNRKRGIRYISPPPGIPRARLIISKPSIDD